MAHAAPAALGDNGDMSSFLHQILGLSPVWIYLAVGLLVFAEDAIFIGFVIPGETAAVLGGVAAGFGTVDFPAVLAIVIAAAIVGDSVGFEIGKHYFGPKILHGHFKRGSFMARHWHRVDRAQDFLQRKGGSAVFLGRFTAFFRAMMPALAGASNMPYRRFLAWNAIGGIIWGSVFVTLGRIAGASYEQVEKLVGRGMAISVGVVAVGVLLTYEVRRRMREAREDREYAETHLGSEPAPASLPIATE